MRARRLGLPTIFGIAVGLILIFAWDVDRGSSIVVHGDDGRVLSRSPLPNSGEFGIQYTHSYYEVPAAEHFVTRGEGSFELVGVSSPSEAVLDYYGLEGRKETTDSGWARLVPEEAPRFEELPLISTKKGKRTLVVSGKQTPLFAESGEPAHLTLRVEEGAFWTRTKLTQASRQTILAP